MTYAIGNGLLLLFGFIQVLIIPRYLSVEGYGYWQLFVLYASYVGILHLGFIDGVLVRWAGKELSQIGNEVGPAFKYLLFQQLIIIIPLCLIFRFLFASHPPFEWIALMILVYALVMNLCTFFLFTTQAIRRFKLLTAISVGRGLVFLILVIILFVSGYLNYLNVVLAFLTAYLLVLFAFLFWFREHFSGTGGSFSSLFSYGRHNIGIGIFVLLGNFVGMLFLTIDRLMVSSLFTIQQFAIYSFAVAVVTVSYTFVTAVSQVFFPYVSAALPDLRTRAYHLGKPAIILSWAASLAIYFPLTKLVEFYLPWYLDSLRVMQILFCTVGFGSLIQILHINYYKAYRRQRDYFILAIAALAMSAMLNLLAIHFWGSLVSVAVATVASFAAWCIANELRLRHIVSQTNWQLVRGLGIILGYLAVFWFVSSVIEGFVAQTVTYVAIYLLLTWLLLRSEVRELVATVR